MPLPEDPLLAYQWHLRNTAPGLLDLNVFGVWDPAQGRAYGAGTSTVVIDDGFDYFHADLLPNFRQDLDFDFESGRQDSFGVSTSSHGTAVAGIIGAAANGFGTVGVAHETEIIGYRTEQRLNNAFLDDVRDAIHHAAVTALADVANISMGIANDLDSEFGSGFSPGLLDQIEVSIGTAVARGRDGLGMTIVKSAGNSRGDSYDVNADDWSNDTRQVVVAAVDQDGFVSEYSSFGAANLVSGFGTPGEVFTTDRRGFAGYEASDFTDDFNGTSSAAPMVAGVVALIYDANAGLGWRDVQSILAASARHVGTEVGGGTAGHERFAWDWNGARTWNGGGQHFSNDYGYGLVDALAAVRLAETWRLTGTPAQVSGNQRVDVIDVLNAPVVIPDGNANGRTFSATAGLDLVVERATVRISFSTTWIGDVEIYLTPPRGTVSQLIADPGGYNSSDGFDGTWTFESQAFRGERAAGAWTVRMVDDGWGDSLSVSDVVIRTFGAVSNHDRFVFTDEYSDYDGVAGHARSIVDMNGGADTVNASAVRTGSVIRLDTGPSSIDGVTVRLRNIENAIGGDGNDLLIGNVRANHLHGMRGDDRMLGGVAADRLHGHTGRDVLAGGPGKDLLVGGPGADRFVFGNRGESPFGAGCDVIRPGVGGPAFDAPGTRARVVIDLRNIDANETVAGNQAFVVNASGAIGTLRCVNVGGVTQVLGYTNGAAGPDFQINIQDGAVPAGRYAAADFLL